MGCVAGWFEKTIFGKCNLQKVKMGLMLLECRPGGEHAGSCADEPWSPAKIVGCHRDPGCTETNRATAMGVSHFSHGLTSRSLHSSDQLGRP